jgi:threonine dehydrogenase-like Zn-dependent dehydrogenase
MKALFYPKFDVLELRDIAQPQPGVGEVLLKVAACGICGSELETFKHRNLRRTPPLIMGHEFCGTVAAVGDGVHISLGERFVSNSVVHCGDCPSCQRGDTHLCKNRQLFGMHRPGGFAEYVVVPEEMLLPWPQELSAEAACLAEPLANGVHVVNLTRHLAADKVLVIGAGPIGLLVQQSFQAQRQAEVAVCDLSSARLSIAQNLGAAKIISSKEEDVLSEVFRWTEGEGVDLVIDAAGTADTKRLSLAALRPGGATVWIGLHTDTLSLDTYGITLPEKQVLGTYGTKKAEMSGALELMRTKQVEIASWCEVTSWEGGVNLFQRMLHPGECDIKGVIVS